MIPPRFRIKSSIFPARPLRLFELDRALRTRSLTRIIKPVRNIVFLEKRLKCIQFNQVSQLSYARCKDHTSASRNYNERERERDILLDRVAPTTRTLVKRESRNSFRLECQGDSLSLVRENVSFAEVRITLRPFPRLVYYFDSVEISTKR